MEDWHGPDEPGEHLVQNGACDGDAVDVFEIEGVMLIVGETGGVTLPEEVRDTESELVPLSVRVPEAVTLSVGAIPVSVLHSKLPAGQSDVPTAYRLQEPSAKWQGPELPDAQTGQAHANVPLGHAVPLMYAQQMPVLGDWHGPAEPVLHAKQAGAGDTDGDGDSVAVAEFETDAADV